MSDEEADPAPRGDEGGLESAAPTASIRQLLPRVYLPNLLLSTGQGAMIPVLVYAAERVHASTTAAGLVVALNGLGTMAFDLPAGRIIARLGERRATSISTALLALGILGCILGTSFPVFACSVLVQAAGWAVWTLVRVTHLSRVARDDERGRALSLFGGVIRAGNVIGPAVFIALAGHSDVRDAFVIYLVSVVVGFGWLVLGRDRHDQAAARGAVRVRPRQILSDHRRAFVTAGPAALVISMLRGSRNAIVPLWAAHIGLSASRAAAIFAFSALVDLALFYPAGIVSDRWGRRATVLPCMIVLALGHILIPFSDSFSTLFLVALVLAFGNGMGAGIVMTLGADLTPADARASFLAVWRLVADGGTAAGPLLDSAIVALGAIALAGPVLGLVGLVMAGVVANWLEEPAPSSARRPLRET